MTIQELQVMCYEVKSSGTATKAKEIETSPRRGTLDTQGIVNRLQAQGVNFEGILADCREKSREAEERLVNRAEGRK